MRAAVLFLVTAGVPLLACREAPTDAASQETVFDEPLDISGPPSGGACPNVFWETTELLDNGVTVTWTSAFGGFDYAVASEYTAAQATWSVDIGSATFVSFAARPHGKTWTPRGRDPVDGTLNVGVPGATSVALTVDMFDMHRGDEEDLDGDGFPDWQGLIGAGHFWLVLDVDDGAGSVERVKLGVNVHLEDPDDAFPDRCPTS
jgi:hypothetical protein